MRFNLLLVVLFVFIAESQPASAHPPFSDYVEHQISLLLSPNYIDATVRFTFHKKEALNARRQVDGNNDRSLTQEEYGLFLAGLVKQKEKLIIQFNNQQLDTVLLYDPVLDDFDSDKINQVPLSCEFSVFAQVEEATGEAVIRVENPLAPDAAAVCVFHAAAGSDVPWGGTVGEVRMYAYIGRDAQFSADAWFDAVNNGRTFVTNGPMIEFTVNGKRPGDEIIVRDGQPLEIAATATGGKGRLYPTELEIVAQGEVIKRVEPEKDSQLTLHTKFTLPADDGFWIAARAKGSDGSQAHTTPVYVKKHGLRFWNVSAAERLLDERMESLQEVEDLLDEYTARLERELGNYVVMQYVQQGPELMRRVEKARAAYRALGEMLKKEMEIRAQSK